MYKSIIRHLLFLFDPEAVHHFVFGFVKCTFRIPFVKAFVKRRYSIQNPKLNREFFGLKFSNPVGLAAGFDKNAKLFNELDNFGFGFIEIGTVTPYAQSGNPRKRLFRLKKDKALINRMGFNNEGVCVVAKRLKKHNPKLRIGGNIGKNKTTPNTHALDDYMISFRALYSVVDYFVVNVSSPNTPGLRDLQERKPLEKILNSLQKENTSQKPILLKISPDLSNNQLLDIISIVEATKISGIIATNTTINRFDIRDKNAKEKGGLSGKPLRERSTEVIKFLVDNRNFYFPIIGVGGIHSSEDAMEKFKAGADLIQLYTGFIYEGPAIVKQINKALL